MGAYRSCKDAARQWGITARRVATLCQNGRIEGAVKLGRTWAIPCDAPKPEDARSGPFIMEGQVCLPPSGQPVLPLGHSDFATIVQNGYYWVDETLLIRDLIDTGADVTLFCRPRRFGKTLNMTMLRAFFERSDTNTAALFRNTDIWACGERYRREQGRYPVIWLSLKDVKGLDWGYAVAQVKHGLQDAAMQHDYLVDSPKCRAEDRPISSACARASLA